MTTKLMSMKIQITSLGHKIRMLATTEPVTGRKPVLALLMPLLWAAVLALPAFGAQAGVVLTTIYSFTGTNDGAIGKIHSAAPYGGLVQDNDGYFYGTTYGGGTNGYGTVFKISTNGMLASLYSFRGTNDGACPRAGLVKGSDGYFYGTTSDGGTNNWGTVFKINTNGTLNTIYSFGKVQAPWPGYPPLDGANPYSGLVRAKDGYFYGTTYSGGSNGWSTDMSFRVVRCGTVFKLSTNGALTSLYSFGSIQDPDGDVLDGFPPVAGLVQGSDGYFYGTTVSGGTNPGVGDAGWGTVFKISTNGVLTSLYSFGAIQDPNGDLLDGNGPFAGLVQGSDGLLYGTTAYGGTNRAGTVFTITTNGVLTSLYSFGAMQDPNGDLLDGNEPFAGPVQGSDGYFYGITAFGGTNGYGTVFKISTDGTLTSLYSFTGGNDGANPDAGLVQGGDGSFYGTTSDGGLYGAGTVFRLTIVPEFQSLTLTSGTLNLTWSTEAGRTYQLQNNSNLNTSNWTNLGSPATATGGTLSFTDSVTNAPQCFYRVMLAQ